MTWKRGEIPDIGVERPRSSSATQEIMRTLRGSAVINAFIAPDRVDRAADQPRDQDCHPHRQPGEHERAPELAAVGTEETGQAAAEAVDGGPCAVGVESTVVTVRHGHVALLRPGAVTREEIIALTGPLADEVADAHRSPGRLAAHYAPDAPVRIEAERAWPGEIFLGFGPEVGEPRWSLSPRGDLREAAANLFRLLREADREQPAGIAVARIPEAGLGEAINDRLRRAAGFVG